MTKLRERQSTKSGRNQAGQFVSGAQHPRAKTLQSVQSELSQLGFTVHKVIRGKHWKAELDCPRCGTTRLVYVDNARKGLVKCASCRHSKYGDAKSAEILSKRYDAMRQRCVTGTGKRYKERGIELRMTREEFIQWGLAQEKDFRTLDVDRIDNDGHYELGNIRLATRSENLKNRSSTT